MSDERTERTSERVRAFIQVVAKPSQKVSLEEIAAEVAALEQEREAYRDDMWSRTETLTAEVERLRAAIQWLVNLAHGVGRAGGPPEEGEWDAAWKNAADCLIGAALRDEGGE